jgi:hypothetical protein
MIALLIEYNPINMLTNAFNEFLDYLGVAQIPNPFEKGPDFFRNMKVELQDYENDFQDFGTFIENQGEKIKKALKGIGGVLNVGGDVSTTNTQALGPVFSDPTPFDPLKNILDSVNFINKEDSLIKVPLFKKGYSVEVDEFTNLMSNIKSISDELNQSFQSFGNVIEGTFAQALQSSDGFFKSFLEGAKRALSALAAQIAATLFLNAVLGSFGIGQALGFKKIGGTTGIGQILGSLVGGGVDTNSVDVGGGLRSMMNTGGGVEVFGTLRGADIILSSDRARNNRNRTRGY